jgi:hypothetical protein
MTSTPSPTVTPTITPTPDRKCWGVTTANLHVRSEPGGTSLGVIPAGDTVTLEAYWIYNGARWYQHYWLPGQVGYSHSSYFNIPPDADCSALPDVTPRETREIKVGCHILMGEGASACMEYVHNMQTAKCLPGSFHICLQMKQANPDLWIVARLFNDKVAHNLDYDLLEFWEQTAHAIPDGYDAWEPENESTPQTIDQWQRWSSFNIGLAKILTNEKNMQLLAFSFGPGWPAQNELSYTLPYLEWVSANPLPDGRYHGVASHAAMFAPWNRADMPWVNEPWIAGRVYKARDYLYDNHGFELATWPGVWLISEGGLSDGYSGSWTAPYTCDEAASAFKDTLRVYAENGYPHALTWWNFGQIGMWTSDHDCADEMFG